LLPGSAMAANSLTVVEPGVKYPIATSPRRTSPPSRGVEPGCPLFDGSYSMYASRRKGHAGRTAGPAGLVSRGRVGRTQALIVARVRAVLRPH
jgi:hypothetical protein